MAHVQITAPHPTIEGATAQVIIDGVDITGHLACDPFAIDIGDPMAGRPPTVSVGLVCESLELNVPEALIHALNEAAARGSADRPRRLGEEQS